MSQSNLPAAPSAEPSRSRPTDETIAHLVAGVAARNPDAIALSAACGQLTYRELDARADALAHYLASRGVGPEVVVGICLDRSFEQIVSILAVLRAGGAFLPCDPSWPMERVRELLRDANAPVVVTKATFAADLEGEGRIVVVPVRDAGKMAVAGEAAAIAPVTPETLAYVIYTSGSTGRPKGVEITHGNLLNLISWHNTAFAVTPHDRASHLAGLGFDASVWEVWPYLAVGACVVLVDENVRTSASLLQSWIVDQNVSIGFVPTMLAEQMMQTEWPRQSSFRALLTGADTLRQRPRADLPFMVVNNYGPTECTVVATSGLVGSAASGELPSIGAPIANTAIYLLGADGAQVSAGQSGEIHIGGPSVGRGYRHQPALTAERFLRDPFHPAPHARMYRTGDLGRLRPDGQIEFQGRIDDQIKIRGHRVEPEEISAVLGQHPDIAACAIVARDNPKSPELVAYVIPHAGREPNAEQLREFIAGRLPDYMIPSAFVRLEALPLTTSGKLARKELPAPDDKNTLGRSGFVAPRSPTEKRLAEIVCVVLGTAQIGIDDNFFTMGGHSLLGTQVVMRAREDFDVDLTLRHLFGAPTVGKLAAVIERLVVEKIEAMTESELRAAS